MLVNKQSVTHNGKARKIDYMKCEVTECLDELLGEDERKIVKHDNVDEFESEFVKLDHNGAGDTDSDDDFEFVKLGYDDDDDYEVVEDSKLYYQQFPEILPEILINDLEDSFQNLNIENNESFYLQNQLHPNKVNQCRSDKSTQSIHASVKYPSDNASHVIKVGQAPQPEKRFKFNKPSNTVELDKDFTTISNTQSCASTRLEVLFDALKDPSSTVVKVQPLKIMHVVNKANSQSKQAHQGNEIVHPSTKLAETCIQAEKTVTISQNADTHSFGVVTHNV